ncbi:MAG: hypothetical protein PHH77_07885 [Victivallaceae bacterium]|nr:hypothetical protein [Victivallaceae bacterium]
MFKERKYGFRNRLNVVHKPDRRDSAVKAGKNELEINDDWKIIISSGSSPLTVKAAKDLQDYLFTSMSVSVLLKKVKDIAQFSEENCIILGTKVDLKSWGKDLKLSKSYKLDVSPNRIRVCGFDDRGIAQACYYLEDLMNLNEAPVLKLGTEKRQPLFSPRMVHSGWGIDQFPDAHLSAIAHAGMDAILVFAKDVDMTTVGYLDFNELVDRAAAFGIDVYIYSYLKSLKHPEEKDALEHYRNTYGKIFKACPQAKGVILVGESCEFPSRDTVNTTGKVHSSPDDDTGSGKPSPGWWPCYDYPQWLEMIKQAVRECSPQAEIVFWTYNWGYAPEKDRLALVNSLPDDITLLVTFEMFEQIRKDNIVLTAPDYTISFAGPGQYFAGEAKTAKKKNIRLYAMSNTAGMTWDFGVVPYIPVPFQWSRRHDALHEARKKWGLSGLMESHHYGFYPSVVSELAKWSFWSPSVKAADILKRIAERDFGEKAVPQVIKCWKIWSDAIRDNYIATNEDQYGPFRIGPSYPLIFHPDITRKFGSQELPMPSAPFAHFGRRIVKTFYHPFENAQHSPGAVRMPVEIKQLKKMRNQWRKGVVSLEKALELTPPQKQEDARRMLLLGKFMENTIITVINLKKWYLLNKKLLVESNRKPAEKILQQLEKIAYDEIKNAENTLPLVEADSRLGWEPSMEYMTDAEHLNWKINQVEKMLEGGVAVYKEKLRLR